ncbi:uncharacterized protein LOC105687428 [Athalia rosae]|uniref:uncharacterized protein LOC105687428 n=1 Tax=Athalia rosae TaxID=37344 RepID=UPI002033C03D|nr:uncharacterized protein LOC105687428 [Athalia rosae]
MGIVVSIILMCLVWQRFQQTPTVTTIDTTSHPIWELAFPSVTICNFNKIYLPKMKKLRRDFENLGLNDTEIENFFQSLPKLIRPEYISVDVAPGMAALAALGLSIEDLMHLLMQPCDKLLVRCAWLGHLYNCSKMFQTIKSIEGFCCAFNYHALFADFKITVAEFCDEKIFQNKFYTYLQSSAKLSTICPRNILRTLFSSRLLFNRSDSDSDVYPCYRKSESTKAPVSQESDSIPFADTSDWAPGVDEIQMVAGSGRDVGLSVVFDLEGHFYGGATRPYIGASVLIHDPEDYPEISLLSTMAEPGKEVDIAITGTIIQSVENIRALSIDQRQCWFDGEAKLGSTEQYSYQTCVTECRIDHILSLCNCVPFYYPNVFANARTCDLTDVKCMRLYRRVLSSLQTPIDMEVENKTVDDAECYCLPQCSDKWYSLSSETANIKRIKYDAPMLEYYSYGLDIRNLSLMNVYFRDITCLKYRKDILLTWDGLFASFGGIFGLCLGGSIVSLVELIYYFAVKIFHRKKRETKNQIRTTRSLVKKLKNQPLPRTEEILKGSLDGLDISKDNGINFHPDNYMRNNVATLSSQLRRFRAGAVMKENGF